LRKRRLHESAFAQFHLGAADHQLLHEKRITEPEDGADIVVLGNAIEHDRNRSARSKKEFVAGCFGAAQLLRHQASERPRTPSASPAGLSGGHD
jgi:hypothetical protein